jgi:hypothetical protein
MNDRLIIGIAVLLAGCLPAAAQIQSGPNISPSGIPFTFAPRAGYLGPPAAILPYGPVPLAYGPPEPPPIAYGPPPGPPPPLGWVYTRHTSCPEPRACPVVFVSVAADGLNVRPHGPEGPPLMSLVNGTPLLVLTRQGSWTLVAPACELVPTGSWSWTAGVPLNRCY